ncbi:MAG: HAD hydrolase-like protein [Elusimicrobia bacterium]|nr:HAD hydrolase-like protein [Elusimicrobiota bacterium]
MKKLVVFDIGNVLLRFSKERARKNFERIDPGSGNELVRAIWEDRLGLDLEAGRINGRQFFKKAGRFHMAYAQFVEAFRDIFTPIPENLRLLQTLSKTHDTALLSNVSDVHWTYLLRTYPVLNVARWKWSSSRLKATKPHPRVYGMLSKKTGYRFEDIVYADDRADFIEAARGHGIRGVLFTGDVPLKKLFAQEGVWS